MIKKLLTGVLLASLAVTALAPATVSAGGGKNVVDRVVQVNKWTGQFDILVKAVAECEPGIGTVLATAPDITVFGPTDRAFKRIGVTKKNVCDVPGLDDILKYHVIDPAAGLGKVTYREAVKLSPIAVPMLNGDTAQLKGRWFNLRFKTENPKGASRIIIPNVRASNGIIHVVNNVLIPPAN
jgi:uncharacterized surface protein with fasciclin (FAS1) repeats